MKPHTILVADEDTDTRIILRALFERHGYIVIDCATAQQAMLATQAPVALIVLNHPMSVAPDLSLAAWLRAQPATHTVPIINLTSRPVPMFVEEASQLGVTVTVPKPIDVHRMVQLVEELTTTMAAR